MKSASPARRGLRVLAVASSAVLFGIVVFRAQTGCVEPGPPSAEVGPDPAVAPAPAPPSDKEPAVDPAGAVEPAAPADAGEVPASPPAEQADTVDSASPHFFPGSKSGGFLLPPPKNAPNQAPQ